MVPASGYSAVHIPWRVASTPMDVDQSLRGFGEWRCPALHIPRSFELQSPDLDQSNSYIEKEIIKIQKKASPETIEKESCAFGHPEPLSRFKSLLLLNVVTGGGPSDGVDGALVPRPGRGIDPGGPLTSHTLRHFTEIPPRARQAHRGSGVPDYKDNFEEAGLSCQGQFPWSTMATRFG